jgi:SAM-dependent methyltransferase
VNRRRVPLVPWTAAGRRAEETNTNDDVVRSTGWVFNNETGAHLTVAEFVASGDQEVAAFFSRLGLESPDDGQRAIVEIGSGIGRMTAALTRRYGTVVACDVDPAFLERCRQTVASHGDVARLRTAEVLDGWQLPLPDRSADVVFSYITLQHCSRENALRLVDESFRVVRPGGVVALNFRTWRPVDALLFPIGALVRTVWRVVPSLAGKIRWLTRLGWQANRLRPSDVLARVGHTTAQLTVYQASPRLVRDTDRSGPAVVTRRLEGSNPAHWWLVARP